MVSFQPLPLGRNYFLNHVTIKSDCQNNRFVDKNEENDYNIYIYFFSRAFFINILDQILIVHAISMMKILYKPFSCDGIVIRLLIKQ